MQQVDYKVLGNDEIEIENSKWFLYIVINGLYTSLKKKKNIYNTCTRIYKLDDIFIMQLEIVSNNNILL